MNAALLSHNRRLRRLSMQDRCVILDRQGSSYVARTDETPCTAAESSPEAIAQSAGRMPGMTIAIPVDEPWSDGCRIRLTMRYDEAIDPTDYLPTGQITLTATQRIIPVREVAA